LCSSYSNSQSLDPVTGLALNSTGNVLNLGSGLPWSGTVTGSAGGSSGGPGPAYNPNTGNIIFSYGLNTASQLVAINTALANAGTGIQLSGYKYSWQINNDLNNSGGNRGTITGNVSLLGSSGNVLESFNYDYSKENLPAFKTYSGTQFFNSRYDTTTANSLTVSFTGKDQNFWAGYYGPRVHVDNLSLLYTVKPTPVVVDPCISDPLSSPTCPGYALATVKNSILGSTVAGASVTSYVPTTNYTQPAPAADPPAVADAAPALAQASPQQQAQQPPPQQQGPQPQQPGQDPNQNLSIAQDNPAQTSPQQAGPPPTSPQPAGGPPQATQTAQSAPLPNAGPSQAGPQQAGPSGNGPSKLAMSVVKSAQAKEQAIQQTAVQNAAKAFENTQQSSQTASNLAISMNQDMSANSATAAAQFSSQTTQASQQTTAQSTQNTQQQQQASNQQQQTSRVIQQVQQQQEVQQQIQQSTSVVQVQQTTTASQQVEIQSTSSVLLKPPAQVATEIQQQSSGTGITVNKNTIGYNPLASFTVSNMSSPVAQTAPVYQPRIESKPLDIETPMMQIASFGGLGKAGNPLSEMIMQQRFEIMQENIQQQTSTVNRNVQPNDLAGGVDLAIMAVMPQGFNSYSFVLKDSAFYEPKEVYKNQKTVDNVQVLRQLSSDRLHQEMVDQQYK